MVFIIYDLLGTLVLQDCQITQSFAPRRGALDTLRAQRRLGWMSALFADDERKLVEEVLLKSGLAGAFAEIHSGEEIDEEGLKNLSALSKKNYWVIFVGDMTRDLRTAKKYGISFVKVLPFTSREEEFDFSEVHELIDAIISEKFGEYKEKHKLEKVYEAPEFIDFAGEHVRIRVYLDRFEAQFY